MKNSASINVEKTAELRGHSGAVYTLSEGLEPYHLFSAGSEGIVARWNLKTQEAVAVAIADGAIFSLKLLKERQILVMGLQSGGLIFFDLKERKNLAAVKVHAYSVFEIQEFPGGKFLIATDQGGFISIWDLDSLKMVQFKRLAPKSIRSIRFLKDKKCFLAGSSDGFIRQFTFDLHEIDEWKASDLSVFRIIESADGHSWYSVGRDAHIRKWIASESGKEEMSVPAHNYAINDLVLHPSGEWMFSGSMDKSIKIWEAESLQLKKVIDFERNQCHKNGINRLLWLGERLYSTGDDRVVMEWKLDLIKG